MTLDDLKTWLESLISEPVASLIDSENTITKTAVVHHLYESYHNGQSVASCELRLCGTVDVAGAAEIWVEIRAGDAVFESFRTSGILDLGKRAQANITQAIAIASAQMAPHLPLCNMMILEQLGVTQTKRAVNENQT